MKVTLHLPSLGAATLRGYRYLWMKRVTGFDDRCHCAKCLLGDYVKDVGTRMRRDIAANVPAADGEVFYLCGVSAPYHWEHNAHLAMVAEAGAICSLELKGGQLIAIEGARHLPFDDQAARVKYPGRGAAFLTCRNFQFGAHHFGV